MEVYCVYAKASFCNAEVCKVIAIMPLSMQNYVKYSEWTNLKPIYEKIRPLVGACAAGYYKKV